MADEAIKQGHTVIRDVFRLGEQIQHERGELSVYVKDWGPNETNSYDFHENKSSEGNNEATCRWNSYRQQKPDDQGNVMLL